MATLTPAEEKSRLLSLYDTPSGAHPWAKAYVDKIMKGYTGSGKHGGSLTGGVNADFFDEVFDKAFDKKKGISNEIEYARFEKEYIDDDPRIAKLENWIKTNQPPQRSSKEMQELYKKRGFVRGNKLPEYKEWHQKFTEANNAIMKIRKLRKQNFRKQFIAKVEEYNASQYQSPFDTLMSVPVLGDVLKVTGLSHVVEPVMTIGEKLYDDVKSGDIGNSLKDVAGIVGSVADAVPIGGAKKAHSKAMKSKQNLENCNCKQLRMMVVDCGLKKQMSGYSRMKKNNLIELLKKHEAKIDWSKY